MKHSANRTRRVVTVAGAAVRATAALNGGAMTGVHSPGCPSLQSETVATDSADGRPTRSTSMPPPTRRSAGNPLFVAGHSYSSYHVDCT